MMNGLSRPKTHCPSSVLIYQCIIWASSGLPRSSLEDDVFTYFISCLRLDKSSIDSEHVSLLSFGLWTHNPCTASVRLMVILVLLQLFYHLGTNMRTL